MELCYDGALVMPSNYAVMSEEEMTYVEGGNGWYNSQAFVAGAIDTILYLVPVIAAANSACKAGKALNVALKAVGATKQALINGAVTLLKKIGFNVSKSVVSTAVGAIWTFAGLSIGGLIAMGIDRADGNYNGYCFG